MAVRQEFNNPEDTPVMTESEFNQLADATLASVEATLESAQAAGGWEADCETVGGILEVEFADGAKLILNRHAPTQDLWLAARSGGYHYRREAGAWRDTRGGLDLGALLAALCALHAGATVVFSL